MKVHDTDQLLTLGMALMGDKRSMERRVRGVFARRKSAKGVLILSLVLALALGFAAFTTACQPGKEANALTPIPVEQNEDTEPAIKSDTADAMDVDLANIQLATAKSLLGSSFNANTGNTAKETHITQATQTLQAGIKLAIDADVFVPATEGLSIQEFTKDSFTVEETETILNTLLPNAKWTTTTDPAVVSADGTVDFSKIDPAAYTELQGEKDGAQYIAALSNEGRTISFFCENGITYDEVFLLGDAEMEREFGAIIREPIALTREAAQVKADELVSRFNAKGFALEHAERACMFDMDNSGKLLSRGWRFQYGLSNANLATIADKGYAQSDRLAYWKIEAGTIIIYVDENGVSEFHWEKRYQPSDVSYPLTSIISVEDALKLAKERIIGLYDELDYEGARIEVFDIRLANMLIGYNDQLTGQPFPEVYEDIALLIPVWNLSFRVLFDDGESEFYLMPFCASDGGAVSLLEQ